MQNPIEHLKNRKLLPLALVFATLTAGILIGTIISGSADAAREDSSPKTDATPLSVPDPEPVENQFSELAQKLRPSVVSIFVPADREEDPQAQGPFDQQPNSPEEMFRRFFGMPPQGPMQPERRRRGPGQGSGVVVDAKGYIITNQHVVEGAESIEVLFSDDKEQYDATLIGSDTETDLAVIHVKGKRGMQAARIGNSEAVNVGDWAVAIGSPFGYSETVTVGIISAKSREMGAGGRNRPFRKFLQTDAAINPGNSGGPLLNIRGEVVGINSAIISRTGGYDGIGFALASNIAVDIYNQIVQEGRVSRGSIGVSFRSEVSPSLLRTYGAEQGVFVTDVSPDSPADRAGMRKEDIIVSVDGQAIDGGDTLLTVVSGIGVGETVPIEVVRAGKDMTLDVKVADRAKLYPEQAEVRLEQPEAKEAEIRLGVTVQELSAERRERMQLAEEGGVVLTKVESGSFADDVGLEPGDVILAVNRVNISSIRELRELQEKLEPGQDVAFKLLRRGFQEWQTLYLAGMIPEGNE